MTRLLHAGFYRLKRNKVFGGCLLVIMIYNLFILLSQYHSMVEDGYEYTLDPLYFNFLALIGILISLLVSLFIGTDYHDGTFRNKLICGLSRTSVYLSNFILMAVCGIILLLAGYALGLALGIPLFGPFEMPPAGVFTLSLISILIDFPFHTGDIGRIFNSFQYRILCCNYLPRFHGRSRELFNILRL